jgi:hypothetical protein
MSYCELLAVFMIPFANSAIHDIKLCKRILVLALLIIQTEPHWTWVSTAKDSPIKQHD